MEPRGFPQPPQGSSWRWALHLSTPGGAGTLGGTGGCERDRAPIPNYTRVPCSSRPTLGLCFTGTAKQVLRGYKKTLKPGRARRARSSANEISARALAYCHRAYVSQQTMLSPEESRHKEHHNSGPNPKQGVTRLSPCPRGSPRGALAPRVAEQPRGAWHSPASARPRRHGRVPRPRAGQGGILASVSPRGAHILSMPFCFIEQPLVR